MASEQFSLCWDNFHKNMSSGMNSLLENEDLVDVTLAVEGRLLKAHKMVLSVCSPYFKELFKSNPCQHPIVFMKDVSYIAISDLLQFMYQGEVQVSQDNLTTFIKTAEALQIKGLTGDGNGSADADSESLPEKPTTRHVEESYKPVSRAKKTAPAPLVTASPAPKRARLSASSASNDSQSGLSVTKTEPVGSVLDASGPVQFKVEPFEQQQQAVTIPDDNTGDENFGDDTLDADNTLDDTEDYSMMEGEEPQAGTSTDGTGEGQGTARNEFDFARFAQGHASGQSTGCGCKDKYKLLLNLTLENKTMLMIIMDALNATEPKFKHNILNNEKIKNMFPLKDLNALVEVDGKLLVDKEMEDQLFHHLRLVGGSGPKNLIRRILSMVFTNDVAIMCSWTGQKQNFRVCDTKIMEVCRKATKHSCPEITAKLFEDVVAEWLRFAKQRKNRELKNI